MRATGTLCFLAIITADFIVGSIAQAQRATTAPDSTESGESRELTEAQAAALLALTAEFDRVYIPALALTNQQRQQPSIAALARLREQAPEITRKVMAVFGLQPSDSARWPTVKTAIEAADKLAREGRLADAHETLEPIRDLLAEDRKRLGLEYPVDKLNEFHAVMEMIVKPAVKATPEGVDQKFLGRLRESAVEASALWARVEQTSFRVPYLQLTAQEQQVLEKSIAAERAALSRLNRALRDGDRAAILQAARAIKPPFAKTYMTIGDFRGLKPPSSR
jgi:hypothetical protein